MPYSASTIANYFINRANEEENYCSPMKVQKLVYYASGWYLGLTESPLINEQIECWKFGPVVRSLYRALKMFGDRSVSLPIPIQHQELPDYITDFLSQIWDAYSQFSAVKLSNMTHLEGTPWKITYDAYNQDPPIGTDINMELIRDHFKELANPRQEMAEA